MSKKLDMLLQECLAGLDAGLSPEECLSAWPAHRDRLEPMLRQAMLLRLSFAAAPSPEFRARTRERFMFAAGREARQALAVQPDPHFVQTTRLRLLNAAGAAAQEALRSVPPPRLAFWMNARRRLLEAGTTGPAAASGAMAPALRMGFSAAAVLVIAISVAAMAYFTTQSGGTTSVGAELAAIDQQLREIEQQTDLGRPASTETFIDLSKRAAAVVDRMSTEQPQAALATKAQDVIDSIKQAASTSPDAKLQVEQQLAPAEQKLFALQASTPLAQPTSAASTPVPASTTAAASAAAASPTTAVPAGTPVPLGPNQARIRAVPGDTTAGLSWSELTTERFRVLLPTSWQLIGPTFGAGGIGTLDGSRIRVVEPGGTSLVIHVGSGEIQALVNGLFVVLRSEDGTRMTVDNLVAVAGPLADELNHILESVAHTPPAPAPTATPTRTATSAPPAASATP